jgi:hypothetical protein
MDVHNQVVIDPEPASDAELDRAFGALADPTRRAIVARLRTGDAGVLELTPTSR